MATTTGLVAAIDQGTTSSRCLIFDHDGRVVGAAQREHGQHFPRPGWVEHDPLEILQNVHRVVTEALARARATAADLVGCGLTNQRETVVVWEADTGRPVHPAIVWQDVRTEETCNRLAAEGGFDRYRDVTGLPLASYFAGPKIAWILDVVDPGRVRARGGELLAGTIDAWLLWQLTGGPAGGRHVTDVTNASRTLLMDLATGEWDPQIADDLDLPLRMLPEIRSSSEVYGVGCAGGPLAGVPLAAALGDQHAALFGQACFTDGSAKVTYGTGSFVLLNTGSDRVRSSHGLLTTVAYQLGGQQPVFALEGSIAVSGSLIQWLRDQVRLVDHVGEVESLAASVADNGGVYVVPAFSGLFAPRWRPDARGVITGLTRYATREHLLRAALESTCYQTREVIEAMEADTGIPLASLRVDGGMVANDLLMQLQADTLQRPVQRPENLETTALGAAFAAGLAVGFWTDTDELATIWRSGRTWQPDPTSAMHREHWQLWNRAVERTLHWTDPLPDPAPSLTPEETS